MHQPALLIFLVLSQRKHFRWGWVFLWFFYPSRSFQIRIVWLNYTECALDCFTLDCILNGYLLYLKTISRTAYISITALTSNFEWSITNIHILHMIIFIREEMITKKIYIVISLFHSDFKKTHSLSMYSILVSSQLYWKTTTIILKQPLWQKLKLSWVGHVFIPVFIYHLKPLCSHAFNEINCF